MGFPIGDAAVTKHLMTMPNSDDHVATDPLGRSISTKNAVASDKINLVGFGRRNSCALNVEKDEYGIDLKTLKTSRDVKMERQRLRQFDNTMMMKSLNVSTDRFSEASVITPPNDFQDISKDCLQHPHHENEQEEEEILEPPAQFRAVALRQPRTTARPKTDMFWSANDYKCIFPLWPAQYPNQIDSTTYRLNDETSEAFRHELQRLKSHSLFLQLPLHAATSTVQYRSSKSVIEYSSSPNHYRVRMEHVTESYQSGYSVSETESDDEEDDGKDATSTTAPEETATLRPRSPSTGSARLSSSSGLSTSQATSSDADSGIDGVAAFGESSTLSPSHSILFIDSARSSVIIQDNNDSVRREESLKEDSEVTNSVADENRFLDEGVRASVIADCDPRRDRSYRVALELLHTERTYVDVLYLLDQVFQFRVDQENRVHNMFGQDLIPQMFSNIKSLFKLHHDFLLPQLEERMLDWEKMPTIGDIITNFAPFLKMYAEYVRNFDHASKLIATMTAKCSRFSNLVDEIQQMPESGNLTLQHHMLTPIQRVPRYEMLLRDYLRRLPEDSADRSQTEKALHLVSTAANHANEAMKKIDQFKQLLEIQESLGGAVDLVSPTRALIKEGKMVKISARSGDHQERYLFLFTDLLLLCSPRLISNRVIGVGLTPYRVRARFNIAHLEVLEGDNLETANTFYLKEGSKSVELYTNTSEEKEAWIDNLFAAMTELTRRKSSLRVSPVQAQTHCRDSPPTPSKNYDLGKIAPTLTRMDSVSRCGTCQSQFSVMRRKHHCHACGKVTCNRCSSHKVALAYDPQKALRVCNSCHDYLNGAHNSKRSAELSTGESPLSSPESSLYPSSLRTGLLEVSVETESVLSGYLLLKTRGKTWQKRWFALRSDFVLYSYRSGNGENRATTATPVPGFTVQLLNNNTASVGDSSNHNNSAKSVSPASTALAPTSADLITERDRTFKMAHVRKTYHFQSSTREEAERWVQYLQMAARADLP